MQPSGSRAEPQNGSVLSAPTEPAAGGDDEGLWLSDPSDVEGDGLPASAAAIASREERWDPVAITRKRFLAGHIVGADPRVFAESDVLEQDPTEFYGMAVRRSADMLWRAQVKAKKRQMQDERNAKEAIKAQKEEERERRAEAKRAATEARRAEQRAATQARREEERAERARVAEERRQEAAERREAAAAARGAARGRGRGGRGGAAAAAAASGRAAPVRAGPVVPAAYPNEPDLPDDRPEEESCVICKSRARRCTTNCGHMIYCVTCSRVMAAQIAQGAMNCATCNATLTGIIRVHGL